MARDSAVSLAACRDLYERGAADIATLAAVSGMAGSRIADAARQEGWQTPESPQRDRDDAPARLRAVREKLVGQLEDQILRGGEAFAKGPIEAISVLIKGVERLEEAMGRAPAEEEDVKNAQRAAALRQIDERIQELAREYARELGGGASEPAG